MAAKKEKHVKVVETFEKETDLIDQALSVTKPRPTREEELTSLGFIILKAGIERLIRVNRDWIVYGEGEAWIVVEGGKESHYKEVITLDELESVCGTEHDGGCAGSVRYARFVTSGRIAVK